MTADRNTDASVPGSFVSDMISWGRSAGPKTYISTLLILLTVLGPLLLRNPYYLHLLILAYLYVILTVSYDIHVGHLGLFSFGQAAFFGAGLYSSAILATKFDIGFGLALTVSTVSGGFLAALMGLITLNLSVFSFKIASIAFYMIVYLVITNWISLTGGPMGIKAIPSPGIQIPFVGSYSIESKVAYYYLIATCMLLTLGIIRRLLTSRIGQAFHAIRDDETRAQAVGINTFKYKMIGLVSSGLFAGLAGSLWAFYVRIAHPDALGAGLFTTLLVILIVGGLGRTLGIVLVACALTVLPEILRVAAEFRQIIYGVVLLLTILYMPEGVGGRLQALFDRREQRRSLV